MLDHPRSAIVGLSSFLKFGIDPIYSFGDIAIFIFWGLERWVTTFGENMPPKTPQKWA